jgi:glycosyltransferase involved in cell wall biosynthesis
MARVCMLVYNACVRDARVLREATALASAGDEVQIVAVRDATSPPESRVGPVRVVRILRNPPHYVLLRALRIAAGVRRRMRARLRRVRERLSGRPPAALPAVAPGQPAAPTRLRRAVMVVHKPLMFLDWYVRAYRLVRAGGWQVVHAHDLNTLPAAVAIAWRTGARLVYDAHELYPDISTLSAREARAWRVLERVLIGRADEVITVSESIADVLVQRHGIRRPHVLLNCPESDGRAVVREQARGALRRLAGVDANRPLVLYQGGFAPNRGLETLIRAAGLLPIAATVVLMGWGRLEDALRQLVAEEALDDRVTLIPPVAPDRLLETTAGADVGVIPYLPVGLNNRLSTPNKLFEYLAAGIPVVASSLPEIERVLDGHAAGRTVPPGDPAALAGALGDILGDPARAEALRVNARRAGRRFTWEAERPKLLALYGYR